MLLNPLTIRRQQHAVEYLYGYLLYIYFFVEKNLRLYIYQVFQLFQLLEEVKVLEAETMLKMVLMAAAVAVVALIILETLQGQEVILQATVLKVVLPRAIQHFLLTAVAVARVRKAKIK